VLPTSDPSLPLDTVTDRLIPADTAERYDRNAMPRSLADALCRLLRSPDEIARRRAKARELAQQMIRPWSELVATDVALLKSAVAHTPSATMQAQVNRAGNR
jgi:hypothetical protein